ncbi:hypothetical protein Daus18300_008411 [Diaporthe australafricana]|uniref:Protein kinase domain-containing protein n=1 Tax=Diaporthe australafricana TaxID=127596 RepID=A0ABR3WIG5_9PEZI
MSIELALAVVGAVDLGYKWGEQIVQLCSSLKRAPKEIFERVVRVEACWVRISSQLEFSRQTANLMDENHCALHHRTLNVLLDKLKAVHRELGGLRDAEGRELQAESFSTSRPSGANSIATGKRIKYALKKTRIDGAIEELETWQGVFDISWLLILRIANGDVDKALAGSSTSSISTSMPPTKRLRAVIRKTPATSAESVFLRDSEIDKATIVSLPFSDASVAERKGQLLILDHIKCAEPAARTVTKDVRRLAQSMRDAATGADSFGWLKCKGVVREVLRPEGGPRITDLTMVFKVPSGYARPTSLREALLTGETCLGSLSDKVKLAKDLARAVSYMHVFGFVHKNIRPETVLLLRGDNAPSSCSAWLKTPLPLFLVGFEKFRSEDGNTYRAGDDEWAKSLYRHPRRQGLNPIDSYVMQHDIYSLGVCLLEIGLWVSFVEYDLGEKEATDGSHPLAGAVADSLARPSDIRASLLALAENLLPRLMGSKYFEVVKTCLTCLDEENEDFSNEDEFSDEDGIVVGLRYVEKVIMQLNSISV